MSVNISQIMKKAYQKQLLVPAFNVAYLAMVRPIAQTLSECETFGIIEVARLEVEKFGAKSLEAVAGEYRNWANRKYSCLHLDHVPVIDEDGLRVDWKSWIQEGLDMEYDSVMIDGSRLPLADNIRVTREVVKMAHERGRPVEAELGAVLGHEKEVSMSYEDIYNQGWGFTDICEADVFVKETGADWLSVAIGNVHGAISGTARDKSKVEARLNIEHLKRLNEGTRVPLVLHGGSGIKAQYVLNAVKNGITKINIGTEIRQAFEEAVRLKAQDPQEAVASRIRALIRDTYHIDGSVHSIM